MKIGGHDILFVTKNPAASITAAIQGIKQHWKNPFIESEEIETFVYQNEESYKKIEKEGITLENQNLMIHFLQNSDHFTMVTDDWNHIKMVQIRQSILASIMQSDAAT